MHVYADMLPGHLTALPSGNLYPGVMTLTGQIESCGSEGQQTLQAQGAGPSYDGRQMKAPQISKRNRCEWILFQTVFSCQLSSAAFEALLDMLSQ